MLVAEQSGFVVTRVIVCYNFRVLGSSLAVGQRTLDPSAKVRILPPQPLKGNIITQN